MARLHKEFVLFNDTVKLSDKRKNGLITSRNSLRDKITKYFKEEKPNELQPSFLSLGSFKLDTVVNPIPEYDINNKQILKYDLDDCICFVESNGEGKKKSIGSWHYWIYNAVENHTQITPKQKDTCVRVIFSDGHNIDLPIRYKNGLGTLLAHKSKGWIICNPEAFNFWFNEKANKNEQLRRIIRYFKAWKNFREVKNTNLKLPSGFALTILVAKNFESHNFDDIAFLKTVEKINTNLKYRFECLRPTEPIGEDLFVDYSYTRKQNFLEEICKLSKSCESALNENNFRVASEYLQKNFGDRFPFGKDELVSEKSNRKVNLIGTPLAPKPYGY